MSDIEERIESGMTRKKRLAFFVAELLLDAAAVALLIAVICAGTGVTVVIAIVLFVGAAAVYFVFLGKRGITSAENKKSPLTYVTTAFTLCSVASFVFGLAFMLAGYGVSMVFWLISLLSCIARLALGAAALFYGGMINAKKRTFAAVSAALPVACAVVVIVLFCTGTAILRIM